MLSKPSPAWFPRALFALSVVFVSACSSSVVTHDGGDVGTVIDTSTGCMHASDCTGGAVCAFATSGCGTVGRCTAETPCTIPPAPYCGCDGVTFLDTCAGPGAPWVSSGACADGGAPDGAIDTGPGTDGSVTDGMTVDVPSSDTGIVADSGGGACSATGTCGLGLHCCGGACVNLQNDPLNCGSCGRTCTGSASMCVGTCVVPTCAPACSGNQVCCEVQRAGPTGPPMCYTGITCPVGCPACL